MIDIVEITTAIHHGVSTTARSTKAFSNQKPEIGDATGNTYKTETITDRLTIQRQILGLRSRGDRKSAGKWLRQQRKIGNCKICTKRIAIPFPGVGHRRNWLEWHTFIELAVVKNPICRRNFVPIYRGSREVFPVLAAILLFLVAGRYHSCLDTLS